MRGFFFLFSSLSRIDERRKQSLFRKRERVKQAKTIAALPPRHYVKCRTGRIAILS